MLSPVNRVEPHISGLVFLARYASNFRRARSYWAPETKKPIRENRFDLKMAVQSCLIPEVSDYSVRLGT